MKRILVLLIAAALVFSFAACDQIPADDQSGQQSETVSEADQSAPEKDESKDPTGDNIPPAFLDATDGKLDDISHNVGEEIDLTAGIVVRDNVTADSDIVITVSDDGGYDKDTAGEYTVTIQAEDAAGNKSTVTVKVIVNSVVATGSIVLGEEVEYQFNTEDALMYTASGTKFRSSDVIQVLEKDVFVQQYNAYSEGHTNNGGVPFFPNGVLVVCDSEYKIVQVRIAAGENIQINKDGSVVNSGFAWTNSLDADNGGGMFKGFIDEIDSLIPDGGYVLIVGNPDPQSCRAYLIKNLFYSEYVSGGITKDNCDVNITNAKIELK